MIAGALAEAGDNDALTYVDALRAFDPAEADSIVARFSFRQGKLDDSVAALESFFARLRSSPWTMTRIVVSTLTLAQEVASRDARYASRLYAALRVPFVLCVLDEARKEIALATAVTARQAACVEALDAYEPYPPWDEDFLRIRYECYRDMNHPLAKRAWADLIEWRSDRPVPFGAGLEAP